MHYYYFVPNVPGLPSWTGASSPTTAFWPPCGSNNRGLPLLGHRFALMGRQPPH